jgi:uncharacterized CHY-type Zn-finger protein
MDSPIIENETKKTDVDDKPTSYTYLLIASVVCLMIFLCYHAYSCFQCNKDINFAEPYINGSPRDDPQDDNAFDVGKEVKKLIQMQEKFLEKLENARRGN